MSRRVVASGAVLLAGVVLSACSSGETALSKASELRAMLLRDSDLPSGWSTRADVSGEDVVEGRDEPCDAITDDPPEWELDVATEFRGPDGVSMRHEVARYETERAAIDYIALVDELVASCSVTPTARTTIERSSGPYGTDGNHFVSEVARITRASGATEIVDTIQVRRGPIVATVTFTADVAQMTEAGDSRADDIVLTAMSRLPDSGPTRDTPGAGTSTSGVPVGDASSTTAPTPTAVGTATTAAPPPVTTIAITLPTVRPTLPPTLPPVPTTSPPITLPPTTATLPPTTLPATTLPPTTVPATVPPTTLPEPDPGVATICARADIDFAALRAVPRLTGEKLAEIPPGDCTVTLLQEATEQGDGFPWYHVRWSGIEGWTAVSNMVR